MLNQVGCSFRPDEFLKLKRLGYFLFWFPKHAPMPWLSKRGARNIAHSFCSSSFSEYFHFTKTINKAIWLSVFLRKGDWASQNVVLTVPKDWQDNLSRLIEDISQDNKCTFGIFMESRCLNSFVFECFALFRSKPRYWKCFLGLRLHTPDLLFDLCDIVGQVHPDHKPIMRFPQFLQVMKRLTDDNHGNINQHCERVLKRASLLGESIEGPSGHSWQRQFSFLKLRQRGSLLLWLQPSSFELVMHFEEAGKNWPGIIDLQCCFLPVVSFVARSWGPAKTIKSTALRRLSSPSSLTSTYAKRFGKSVRVRVTRYFCPTAYKCSVVCIQQCEKESSVLEVRALRRSQVSSYPRHSWC